MMRTASQIVSVALAMICATRDVQAANVTVERSDRGAIVRVDGEMFAEYLSRSGHQPAVWPIIGPTGKPMTRSYPIGPLLDTETDDHPHHHSLWFAHEDVNGHNLWAEPAENTPPQQANFIRHVDFTLVESVGDVALVVANNEWRAGDKVVCVDQRALVFGADDDRRWIDFTIQLRATNGPVTFGDIKDGTFSVRVAGSLKVDSGGTLVNSTGQKNSDAWGMPAEWIDNYGTLDGETVGVAMFSHPDNFQHPCRWHARNYGLLCANPFGDRQFPKSKIKQQGVTIREGESMELRYQVVLHRGDTTEARIAEAYSDFASSPIAISTSSQTMREGFENGMNRWEATDADMPESVWSIEAEDGDGTQNHYLRVAGQSKYQPPVRSPHSIVWLKEPKVGKFELTAKVQNTNVDAGPHRDLCFFWGRQDASHFYYVHLGAKPDPHSSQIFIVNGADRKAITSGESPGIPWTNGWHNAKVRHHPSIGLMQVYFDDMQFPVLTATDTTFSSGQVGLGTFDDHGNFDDVKLRGKRVK